MRQTNHLPQSGTESRGCTEGSSPLSRVAVLASPERKRVVFDLSFGVALPVVCFVFDPAVFRGSMVVGDPTRLAPYKFFAYTAFAITASAFLATRFAREPRPTLAGFGAGALCVGAALAWGLGVFILPMSALGLIVAIGALGFTPFVTGFVFARTARNTLRKVWRPGIRTAVVWGLLIGALTTAGVPAGTDWYLRSSTEPLTAQILNALEEGDLSRAREAAANLRPLAWAADLDDLVWAYACEEDDEQKAQAIADVYGELTGEDIERRLRILDD